MMQQAARFQTHRGYWVEGLTENTMPAFIAAKARGSQMIEFDVRLTRDYVPVVYHDASLRRLHKVAVNISALTLKQLRVFAPDVPLLEDVLASDEIPGLLNIELKTDAVADPALEIRVCQLVRRYRAEERVVLSSFNPFSLIRAKSFAPEVARALLVTEEREAKNFWFLRQMRLLPVCGAQFLHWDQRMTTEARVQEFKKRGFKISVYTVNERERADELFGWGVDSLISDRLLEERSAREESSEGPSEGAASEELR
jgi:glycerophosphoryl diester phosphodiesterase